MAPFIVLASLFALFRGLGVMGVSFFEGWYTPLRFALSGMFLLTASAHWGKRRGDLVRMVPPRFPQPERLVTITGLLELGGALGLLVPLAPYAATGLALLLVALFPANVHAARAGLTLGGSRSRRSGLTVLQIAFAATLAVALRARMV
jgi:uncharacterized membrane protein